MDNSTLENFRKKIINELGRKEDSKQVNAPRAFDPQRNQQPNHGFRRNFNDQNKRFMPNGRNRPPFQDRDRKFNRNREK